MKASIWNPLLAGAACFMLASSLATRSFGQAATTGQPGQAPTNTPVPESKPGTPPPGWDEARAREHAAQAAARPAPPEVLYLFLFEHLVSLNDAASKQEAKGQGRGSYGTVYSRAAGLTDDEGAILNQVALDWKEKQDEVDARRKAILDARRAEPNPPKNLLTMDEFSQFGKEGIDITLAHIEELKSQLGNASFAKLDAYVKVRFRPAVAHPERPLRMPERPVLNLSSTSAAASRAFEDDV
jgi:hypothetical protein